MGCSDSELSREPQYDPHGPHPLCGMGNDNPNRDFMGPYGTVMCPKRCSSNGWEYPPLGAVGTPQMFLWMEPCPVYVGRSLCCIRYSLVILGWDLTPGA